MGLDIASLFVSPYDVRARDAPLRRSPFLKYIFYFNQLANCHLEWVVGDLPPPAGMGCLPTSIIHWW
jgi:hypothetical protein